MDVLAGAAAAAVPPPPSPPPHRSLAQEALSWYMSQLDPYTPHSENIQMCFKGPVLAVTIRSLYPPTALDPAGAQTVSSSSSGRQRERMVEEEKKQQSIIPSSTSTGKIDWNEYTISSSDTSEEQHQQQQRDQNIWNDKGQEVYDSLTRRAQARMEAFLAGCILAVPNNNTDFLSSSTSPSSAATTKMTKNKNSDTNRNKTNNNQNVGLSLADGLSSFRISPQQSNDNNMMSRASSIGTTSSGKVNTKKMKYPQIPQDQLLIRLELYIRSLHRIRTVQEECVIAMEPPKYIKARARCLVSAFVATAGCVQSVSPVLTRLLSCLTKEVLAVETIAPDLHEKIIKRIVLDYEHGISFASLAFLSTPETSADSSLMPLILKYLRYLQSDWESLIQACELERLLCLALNPRLRSFFKNVEFQSIGHLLEICHSYDFRSQLSCIELAPTVCVGTDHIHNLSHSTVALRQALLDLKREVITVNGHVLPPVTSRTELIQLLSQTLNSRTITAMEKKLSTKTSKSSTPKSGKKKKKNRGHNGTTDETDSDKNSSSSKRKEQELIELQHRKALARTMPTPIPSNRSPEDDILFSSEYESSDHGGGNTSSSMPPSSPEMNGKKIVATIQDASPAASPAPRTNTKRRRRRNFQLSTIDLLTRRLLIAASRTGTSGDAFFIVRDLFGGEDVEVVPSNPPRPPNHGKYHHYHHRNGNMSHPGTIDILVRLASVTIKCHSSFDVYPKSLVGECEPLIQFHTTTTETISLQEVRSTDAATAGSFLTSCGQTTNTPDDSPFNSSDEEDENGNKIRSIWIVQERQTPKTGWRTISIRPALYEKVEEWNTPS